MNREYHCWYSERLSRNMELLVFGHTGAKVLVFPTRDGRFYEYEDLGIVHALADKIQAGHLQLYCVDSIDQESFYSDWSHPAYRIQRHMQFEEYILNEVMPLMAGKNAYPCTIAHGCSLGAYHATNIAFRHPHLFQKLCAFSGRYDLTLSVDHFHNLFHGYYDEHIYHHTPSHFLPQLDCDWRLQHLRGMDMVFAIGKQDPFIENNRYLSHLLWSKGIWHAMHEWDGRAHRGKYWRKMAPLYL
ncbi:MAG: alpha/beta hydrolase-fold protein [Methylococcales bacterium]